jgi:hypothetical protein
MRTPVTDDSATQPDAGAMAEAREIVNNIYGGFDSHVTPKGNMLIDAIATALTRREAAAFARGVQVVCKIADAEVDKLRPTDWRAEVGTGFKTAQRIASAARALLGEGKK